MLHVILQNINIRLLNIFKFAFIVVDDAKKRALFAFVKEWRLLTVPLLQNYVGNRTVRILLYPGLVLKLLRSRDQLSPITANFVVILDPLFRHTL